MSAAIGLSEAQRKQLNDIREMTPGIEREQALKALAKDCGVTLGAVREELGLTNGRPGRPSQGERQGAALTFADPVPWPDPVDGARLLDELAAACRRFAVLPDHADAALALWIVHAHAHDAAEVSPVLSLTSPTHRCGKTTVLEVLGELAPRPLPVANVTTAALFRAVEKYGPTLLIDEGDSFLKNSDELRGVLNSGHRCRSAYVMRTVGDDHEPRTFRTWAPKVIAMIGKLHVVLADRSIEVPMRRKTREEKVERLRLDRLDELEPLRRQAWTWAQANLDALRAADPDVPAVLHDRAADNWRPLLAIADRAGGEFPTRARAAALGLSGAGDDDQAGVLVLHDLSSYFDERGEDVLASEAVVQHLVTLDERPWPEWSRGRPLSKRGLAWLLAPFGVRSHAVWLGGRTVRGYRREDLDELLSRYPHPFEVQGLQEPSPGAANAGFEKCKAAPPLADAKSGDRPVKTRGLADLADEQTPIWTRRV